MRGIERVQIARGPRCAARGQCPELAPRKRYRVLQGGLAVAVTGGLLLAGCGGNSSGTANLAASTSTAPATTTASPTTSSPGRRARRTKTAGPTGRKSQRGSLGLIPVKTPGVGPLSREPQVGPFVGAAPSALEVKDLIKGTGPEARRGQELTVNYVGVVYGSGRVFETSWKTHQPLTFTLGRGQVIAGWDQGLEGMKVGGRRELIVPAALAYRANGKGHGVPANAPLVFVVDLLSAVAGPPEPTQPVKAQSSFGKIVVSSPGFNAGGSIPARYTCAGANISPPLEWHGVPSGTAELFLLVINLSGGSNPIQWAVAGIPPSATGMSAGSLPAGAVEGASGGGSGKTGWGGICSVDSQPRQLGFLLYALRRKQGLKSGFNAMAARNGVKGTLAMGVMLATYTGAASK
jgi:peptidylprolyl isomerase